MAFPEGNQYGNRNGAPIKEGRFKTQLEKLLSQEIKVARKDVKDAETIEEYEKAITRLQRITERVVSIAEAGEKDRDALDAMALIRDTIGEKPINKNELTGADGSPLFEGLNNLTNEQLERIASGRSVHEGSSETGTQPTPRETEVPN